MKSTPPLSSWEPTPLTGLVELYRDEYVCILVEPKGPLVRLVRSELRFPSRAVLEATYQGVLATLARHGQEGRFLLTDMRAAPGRNDPWFEDAMREIRPRLFRGFVRLSVLVSTNVGALQLDRISKEDGIDRLVSTDEAAIFEYLKSGSLPRASKRGGPPSR